MSPRIDRDPSTAHATHQGRLALPVVGDLWLAWNEVGLVSVGWVRGDEPPHEHAKVVKRIPASYGRAFRDYDQGKAVDPADLPADLRQGTAFQRKVWAALRTIPRGRVRTYASVGRLIDNPRAMRAIGMANNANPLTIVVPCHRVVAAGMQLGGYGGGVERKKQLLQLEGVVVDGDTLRPGQLALFE
ncbi:MAG: methylated-DNA--[protein]-cysteine S-methyltransferase [Deltaproteobacteria bacterium]|nr:methylated-DNA--[protein]-cysteine S-methyltransferase [Deltaproteobacteria bacterium]